jgi:hypothetical protein
MATSNGVQHDPLARFYARMQATRETVSSVNVGERFSMTSSSSWRSGGVRGVHTFGFIVEITATDSTGVEYETVEIVSEVGRPPFAEVSEGPSGGSCTHLYMVEGIASGSIVQVG